MYCGWEYCVPLLSHAPSNGCQSRYSILRDKNDNCVNNNAIAYYRNMPNRIGSFTALLAIVLTLSGLPFVAAQQPIPVKVVVVAMFEVGEDTGDMPGELQYWVERDHLDRVFPLPAGYHSIRMNGEGEMAVLTGQGTAHAAATIMALGLDPRFDLTHAYWIIAGIAGGSPDRVSLGSAAWARWVVDGDLGYEIDPREMPGDWPTGYIPLRKTHPFEKPAVPLDGQVFKLNSNLGGVGLQPHPSRSSSPTPTNSNRFAPVSMEHLPNCRPPSSWETKFQALHTGTASFQTHGQRSG